MRATASVNGTAALSFLSLFAFSVGRFRGTRLCDLCFAQKPANNSAPAMNYKNMESLPAYELTEINHATYLATHKPLSPFLKVEGFSLHTCVYDVMHNLYLGCGKHYLASGLRVLLEKGFFDSFGHARATDEMFAKIMEDVHDTFKDHQPLNLMGA